MTPRDFSNFSVQVITVLTYFGIHYSTTGLITKKVFHFLGVFIFILKKFIRRRGKYHKLCAQFWVSFCLPKSILCQSFYLKYKGVRQFFLTKVCVFKADCIHRGFLPQHVFIKDMPLEHVLFEVHVFYSMETVTFRRQKTTEGFTLFICTFLSFMSLDVF